jgi:hypothetical protein
MPLFHRWESDTSLKRPTPKKSPCVCIADDVRSVTAVCNDSDTSNQGVGLLHENDHRRGVSSGRLDKVDDVGFAPSRSASAHPVDRGAR